MNEMQADVERARIEADLEKARIELKRQASVTEGAKWQAESEKERAKRAKLFDRDNLLFTIGLIIVMLLVVGGWAGQHVYHIYNYNKTVAQCQESGGTWTTKFQDIIDTRGDKQTESFEVCDREVPYP